MCNKPCGSGEGEISGFPGFEGHWSRFQRKASICSKTRVINRVVPERMQLSAKSANLQHTCVITRALPEGEKYSDFSECANWQQNLCNKPYGSGDKEMSEFPGFEGHWSRFQRKASICSKTRVINRVVPERGKFPNFQGSNATDPDFSEKRQFAAKPV